MIRRFYRRAALGLHFTPEEGISAAWRKRWVFLCKEVHRSGSPASAKQVEHSAICQEMLWFPCSSPGEIHSSRLVYRLLDSQGVQLETLWGRLEQAAHY